MCTEAVFPRSGAAPLQTDPLAHLPVQGRSLMWYYIILCPPSPLGPSSGAWYSMRWRYLDISLHMAETSHVQSFMRASYIYYHRYRAPNVTHMTWHDITWHDNNHWKKWLLRRELLTKKTCSMYVGTVGEEYTQCFYMLWRDNGRGNHVMRFARLTYSSIEILIAMFPLSIRPIQKTGMNQTYIMCNQSIEEKCKLTKESCY